MPYPCPYCTTVGTYRNNLRMHLMGKRPPGHELSREEADAIIDAIERGGAAQSPPAPTRPTPRVRRRKSGSGAAIRPGHRRALGYLADTEATQQTLRLYEDAVEAPVYLRVTDKGFTVMSLDHERCASMIGVGGRDERMEYLTALPATPEYVARAAAGYRRKRDTLDRASTEERFSLELIRGAVENGLRLPGSDLYFVHQEWRMPTETGGGKLDLLAVDIARGELVVIELKGDEAKTRKPDKHGRDAAHQALHYAEVLHDYRDEAYPFFEKLAQLSAKIWNGPKELAALKIEPHHEPRSEVWWPAGRHEVL